MEQTTTVTPHPKRVSARHGQHTSTQKECTPTGENNTPEEATVTETERLHDQIPDITPEEATVTETERFRALVQVILYYYANNLLEEKRLSATELEHPHQQKKRHHHQRLEKWHQGLEYYRKKLWCLWQELHILFRPVTHILQRRGRHRMRCLTRPLVQDPIKESRVPSTTRTRREHWGQTSRPLFWILPTPRDTRFGSRRKRTGRLKSPTTYHDAIYFTDQYGMESPEPDYRSRDH